MLIASGAVKAAERCRAVDALPKRFATTSTRWRSNLRDDVEDVTARSHRGKGLGFRRHKAGRMRRHAFEFARRDLANQPSTAVWACRLPWHGDECNCILQDRTRPVTYPKDIDSVVEMLGALLAFRFPLEALASVEGEAGENRDSPEDRCPRSHRGGEEAGHPDGEKEACVGGEEESCSANESEHGVRLDHGSGSLCTPVFVILGVGSFVQIL